jgi:hypothetical protein
MPVNKGRWKFTPPGRRLPGRPAGKKPFHEDKKRFVIVLATALMAVFKFKESRADEIAILLVGDRRPLNVALAEHGCVCISYEQTDHLEDRREFLAASARKLFTDRSPTKEEMGWLIHSFLYLTMFLKNAAAGKDYLGCIDQLLSLGWEPIFQRFSTTTDPQA